MKKILTKLTKTVCVYLKVNEDLFFCAKNDQRINSAKKYISYLAYYKFNIPLSVISSYMGVSEKRASISMDRAIAVYKAINYDYSSQTALDIAAIQKIIT